GAPHADPAGAPGEIRPLHDARDAFERDYILAALARQQGNISKTAEALGVERSNLYRKMRALGIAPSRGGEREDEARESGV
ncbi:MAG TPA: helix-turn-helix domain-containing protein, partial [Vicinamibacterales bacterium]|nr:helix-turn-helix domain-containing protein [Vicinamibacterales bacterium]